MYLTITLSNGEKSKVDFVDFFRFGVHKWAATKSGTGDAKTYAHRRAGKIIRLHREILNAPAGLEVDHENGDTLDNRRSNLRLCTRQQNAQARVRKRAGATSQYRGVSWNFQNKSWKAQIGHNNKRIHIGEFDDEIEAAKAYDAKARELFGEWASPNFV